MKKLFYKCRYLPQAALTLWAASSCLVPRLAAGAEQDMASDLKQLWQSYHEVAKATDPAVSTWQLAAVDLDLSEQGRMGLLQRELTALQEQGMDVQSVRYTADQALEQAELLRSFKGAHGANHTLCDSFAYEAFKPKAGQELSAEELGKRQAKHMASQCRRHINSIFSGIFHARPRLTTLSVQGTIADQAVFASVVYVPSLTKEHEYLRYSVTLR